MVDANVVAMKMGELTDRIGRVRSHCPDNAEDLAADRDTLDLVSFNLLLAVQTCLDLASHVISDEGWPPVATARGALERLEDRGVISKETARSLNGAVGLRNVVPMDTPASVRRGFIPRPPLGRGSGALRGGSERLGPATSLWLSSKGPLSSIPP